MLRAKTKIRLCWAVVVFALVSISAHSTLYAQTSSAVAKINGKIEGLNNQMVHFTSLESEKVWADSVQAKDGTFSFAKQVPGTFVCRLKMGPHFMTVPVSPGDDIRLEGKLSDAGNIRVTGSTEWQIWQHWNTRWEDMRNTAGGLYKLADSLQKSNGDRTQADEGFRKLDAQLLQTVLELAEKNPHSEIVPYIVIGRYIDYPNPENLALVYEKMGAGSKKSLYGREITRAMQIAAKTAIGVSPSFSLTDIDGKTVSLSDFKGQYVFVDFWASWCGPCRKENPHLVEAYQKYHDQGLEIIGISLDDKKANWLKAIEADKLPWVHLSDLKGWQSDLAIEYGIKSIPMNFLVDRDGKIIAKDLRGEALAELLASIL